MAISPLTHRSSAFNSVVEHIAKDVPHSNVYIHRLKSTVAPLGSSVSALVAMHGNPNPTQTRAYNDKKLIETADKLDDRRKQTFQDIQSVYRAGLLDIQARIDQKVKLKPDEFASEIRATIRTMSMADRLAALEQIPVNPSRILRGQRSLRIRLV